MQKFFKGSKAWIENTKKKEFNSEKEEPYFLVNINVYIKGDNYQCR